MFEDRLPTATSKAQNALEKKVLPIYQELEGLEADELDDFCELNRAVHVAYVQGGLGQLSPGFAALDASRPWICYWLVHSLALLDAPMPASVSGDDVVAFLAHCQHPQGGFGGSPLQPAHLAPTYAAVSAAVTIGSKRAYEMVDREALWRFLLRMCVPPERGGGITVHDGEEWGPRCVRGDGDACWWHVRTSQYAGMRGPRMLHSWAPEPYDHGFCGVTRIGPA